MRLVVRRAPKLTDEQVHRARKGELIARDGRIYRVVGKAEGCWYVTEKEETCRS